MSYVKCPVCNETFNRDKEENIYIGRRYYHTKCCTEDQIYKVKIFLFLDKIWGTYTRTKIESQIAEFNRQNHISTKQVYEDLVYFFEILKNDTTKYPNTIKIIPFIHNDAQAYYYHANKEEERKETVNEALTNVDFMETKIIYGSKIPKRPKQLLQTKTTE